MRSSTLKIHKKIHARKPPNPKISEVSVNDLVECKNEEKVMEKLPRFNEIWKQNNNSENQEKIQEFNKDIVQNQVNIMQSEQIPLINLKLINEELMNHSIHENLNAELNPSYQARQYPNEIYHQGFSPSGMYCIQWVMTPTAHGTILTPINSLNLNYNNPCFTPMILNPGNKLSYSNQQNVSFGNLLECLNESRN